MRKLAINATNLHVGGGIQVAVSVLAELARMPGAAREVDVWVSTEVASYLGELGVSREPFHAFGVRDSRGIRQLWSGFNHILRGYDAVFTIFGPLYTIRRPRRSVVGFAQAWITYPVNDAYALLRAPDRWKARLKFRLQAGFFQRADRLVVELPHIRERLHAQGWTNGIDVVPNCISRVYQDRSCWRPVVVPSTGGLRIGIVTRDYPHKNLGILPKVRRVLLRDHALEVSFLVTLTDSEWRARTEEFRSQVVNVGTLSPAQCPSFYDHLDGVIFPSLLESFSATPIEALAMGLPLFASDRDFVRDVCGDAATYFDPTDPASIAASIAQYFRAVRVKLPAGQLPREYTDPSIRARRYLEILRGEAGRSH